MINQETIEKALEREERRLQVHKDVGVGAMDDYIEARIDILKEILIFDGESNG